MFGQNFAQTLQQVRIYIQKYGEEQHHSYFTGMIWDTDDANNIKLYDADLQQESLDFMTALENKYQTSLKDAAVDAKSTDDFVRFFSTLQQNRINLNNQGSRSQMHYCLYFPLYEPKAWHDVKNCIAILNDVQRPVEIDLIGISSDLAELFTQENEKIDIKQYQKTTKETLKNVIDFKKKANNSLLHFIVMQNCQRSGISLNLSTETFSKLISEFIILCIECYDELFGLVQPNSELQGLGLSVLSIDKYYYVKYLLHKAYLYSMERERILGIDAIEEVDINMATNTAQSILKNKIHILSDFFDNEIKKRLNNNESHDVIVQEITPILKSKMEMITTECEKFITDDKLSIPAKRTIFSALLGEDDELFDNQIFTEEPLLLDDIDAEALQIFIDANNALLNIKEQETETEAEILEEGGEPVVSPLQEIRKMRTKIIRTTGYIRKLEGEVEKLGTQVENIEESKKSLTDDGFYEFGGTKYILLPKIDETPLQEDYKPHAVKSKTVDLRDGFTSIKNQGAIGSCTAFSVTSIFEYILKSNKQKETDLSEAFLFYNARKKAGNENDYLKGSVISYAIESLVEDGICTEEKWRYKTDGSDEELRTFYSTEPSTEAKDDALLRKVKKAVNVKLSLNDIKSALEDGYPVEVSVNLYDSFNGQNSLGIISLPTAEEIENAKKLEKNSAHAMVLCGFSDEEKLFIVRNSWGKEWGDKGYCYMPYSYITNPELTNATYAITDVAMANVTAKGIVTKRTSLPFGDDVKIRYAIKKNTLDEERIQLEVIKSDYFKLRLKYNELHEKILNPHRQTVLTDSTQKRLANEKQELQKEYEKSCNDMDEKLDDFDDTTKRKSIYKSLPFIILILCEVLYCYLYYKLVVDSCVSLDDKYWINFWSNLVVFVLFAIILVAGIMSLIKKRKAMNSENLDSSNETEKKQKSKEEGVFNLLINLSILAIIILVVRYLIAYPVHTEELPVNLYNNRFWIIGSIFFIGIATVGIYIWLRIRKRKLLKNELQEVCDECMNNIGEKENELKNSKLRMHLAGMILSENSKLEHNLSQKYQFMRSFFVNLNTWYTEESSSLKIMNDQIKAPFISIISNNTLDKYFAQKYEALTKNISFCNIFESDYHLSEKGIGEFQKTIKKAFCEELLSSINIFSIYDFIAKSNEEVFLDNISSKELLADLENKSEVFIQHSKSPNTSKSMFIFTRNEDEKHNLNNIVNPYFSILPFQNKIISPLKMIMVQMEELMICDLYL